MNLNEVPYTDYQKLVNDYHFRSVKAFLHAKKETNTERFMRWINIFQRLQNVCMNLQKEYYKTFLKEVKPQYPDLIDKNLTIEKWQQNRK